LFTSIGAKLLFENFVLIQVMYLYIYSARFIGNHGFSIGVDDVQPGESLNEKKGKTIGEGYQECHELIAQYSKGALKPQPGCTRAQTLEARISGVLNKLRDIAGDVSLTIFLGSLQFINQLASD
jgi:DNA-directed RNA polymerase beta' subunit